MKVGDLVKFKVHDYHKFYGVGVVLGTSRHHKDSISRRPRLRVFFSGEQVVARFDELELISESW